MSSEESSKVNIVSVNPKENENIENFKNLEKEDIENSDNESVENSDPEYIEDFDDDNQSDTSTECNLEREMIFFLNLEFNYSNQNLDLSPFISHFRRNLESFVTK